ncbi:endoglucanase 45A [Anaeromyces robustus]|jgi:hypothetical protein|uniref:Cellulase n=1 Tax=Anaeromyces robustus TaxID=1754192 RepID=A0A1Y1X4A0_9FUNG|nr:endoglucanase 45A [Anaeromyces robustus]|eukprot:ORX80640.1 endoglucanase 45A [Anaeromyces robustus]
MKLSITSCIALAAAVAKVSADCFSTRLGYPCCSPNNTNVVYADNDGDWGIENGNWCGMSSGGGKCELISGGASYPCCENTCAVQYTDADGQWGIENGEWCSISKSEKCRNQPQPVTRTTTTTSEAPKPTSNPYGVPENPPAVQGGKTGKTTRYWDCCLASCSWSENVGASHPVNACKKDGTTLITDISNLWRIKSGCQGGEAYMCNAQQPWIINDKVSYGFVAAGFDSGNQKQWCCSCQKLQFTSGPVAGKQMIVQVTNTGTDLSENHFDIQMPGGGVGIFNGCSSQWNAGSDGWGQRFGGISSVSECSQLPAELRDGCKWRFDWFKNADNPAVVFERVQCPKELTDITGCIPPDDAQQKKPW